MSTKLVWWRRFWSSFRSVYTNLAKKKFDLNQRQPLDSQSERKEENITPSWSDLGLHQSSVEVLRREGFLQPTPVQVESLPFALRGRDLLVSAKTGSGKTAAFCLPMIEKIRGRRGTLGLVLCPTREIALQTHQTFLKLAKPQGIDSIAIIGGAGMAQEEAALKQAPGIIVATPGKMADHYQRGHVWLEYVEIAVLDEADRMLDMGFSKEVNLIMDALSPNCQKLLFSATVNSECENLAKKILKNPQRINVGTNKIEIVPTIKHRLLWLNEEEKVFELKKILKQNKGIVIVFVNKKERASELFKILYNEGFRQADYLSSDKSQKEREKTVQRLHDGETNVLVATEVAGRGLHVENVTHVVNYDFPRDPEEYVHRVGRTGRKGTDGLATSLVTHRNIKDVEAVQALLGYEIHATKSPNFRTRVASQNSLSSKSNRRFTSRGVRRSVRFKTSKP